MSLYNMKENGSGYKITKFDEELNPGPSYTVTARDCECKAGIRPHCRHRQMLTLFQHFGRVNTGWFYAFEEEKWLFLDSQVGLVSENRVRGWWRRA